MKLIQAILITFALSLVASCGGGASLAEESQAATSDFVSALKGIDSVESAKAAVPELTKIAETMASLQTKMSKLSPEEMAEAAKEAVPAEAAKTATDMMAEMQRLASKPEITTILAPIFEKMNPATK